MQEEEINRSPLGPVLYTLICQRLGMRNLTANQAGPAFFEFGPPVPGAARVRLRFVDAVLDNIRNNIYLFEELGSMFVDEARTLCATLEEFRRLLHERPRESDAVTFGADDYITIPFTENSDICRMMHQAAHQSSQFAQRAVAAYKKLEQYTSYDAEEQ